MVEVKKLAEQILKFLHQEEEKQGHLNVTLASLYKAFENEASYDVVQSAVRFLSDRDLIAPFSYSLTAKGRREHGLRQKT
ncbi:MAG: hypothetical protein ABSF00_11680 [Candidatus Bathyarchaeia archaeon]|jgi:hypothetical protein